MTPKQHCLDALRGFIARADRGELAEAQAAIIQFALAQPDLAARSAAMADLQQALAGEVGSGLADPIQQAYYAVIDAMIDRTRDAVLDPKRLDPKRLDPKSMSDGASKGSPGQ